MADPATLVCQGLQCFCPTVLPAIQQRLAEEIHAFLRLEQNWSSLKTETDNLRATLDDLKALVGRKVPTAKFELWQRRVEQLQQRSPTPEDYEKLRRCLCCCCCCRCTPNLVHRYRLGKQVEKKLQEVIRLVQEGNGITLVANDPQPPFIEEGSRKAIFGMDSIMEKLWRFFDDENKSIIGIWGQGGIGKTTLLNRFNNELKDRSADYHVVIKIEVSNSETLNVADIQSTIADRLDLCWNDDGTEAFRAKQLLRALKEKRFVLLLDDVWEDFSLEAVGIPTPSMENNCKLIVASRYQKVCNDMGANESLIRMQCLDDAAAWNMFCSRLTPRARKAIDEPSENNAIREHASAIVRRCEGLPLALSVVGTAVAGLRSSKEWRYAATAMEVYPSRLPDFDRILARLKYGYDKLDAALQQCFLYCTLFPAHGSIKKDQLVDYWIAEGLIAPGEGRPTHDDLSDEGHFIIRSLISKSLLQGSDDAGAVKMHNIIRRLGRSLDEGKFLVRAGGGLERVPEGEDLEGFTRISLMSNDLKDLPASPNCRKLRTLLLQKNPKLDELSPRFFRFMPNLRVLDLSYTAITKLPDIDALTELELLNLCRTRITALPKRLWILKQLRHLNLSKTSALKEIPNGTISKLYKLRVLNLYKSHYGIREVADLNLDGLEELDALGITIYSKEVLGKLKKTDPLVKSTHLLSLNYCETMKSIPLSDLKHMEHLEELHVESCNELEELIADNNEQNASSLQVLTLATLPNLEKVSVEPVRHLLKNLRDLSIDSCPKLEDVSWVLQLESLQRLVISRCHGMESIVGERINGMQIMGPTWTTGDNGIEGTKKETNDAPNAMSQGNEIEEGDGINGQNERKDGFSRLKTILLNDLPKLEIICRPRDFPCLESIRVEACPNLRRLPLVRNSRVKKLKQVSGSRDWWNNLVWEENTKPIFSGHFTPI